VERLGIEQQSIEVEQAGRGSRHGSSLPQGDDGPARFWRAHIRKPSQESLRSAGYGLGPLQAGATAVGPMEHYSFQGPYAYRWCDDQPVERIDLRSGERRRLLLGSRLLRPHQPMGGSTTADIDADETRSRMATWN
jgi:hypothetical protein